MRIQYYFLLLLICSCSDPASQKVKNAPLISETYTDGLDRKISFQNPPSRLISLAPSITEMIYAIGGEEKLLAVSQACNFPPETNKKRRIETYPELDFESIVVAEPDLVLATDEIIDTRWIPRFKKLNTEIFFQQFRGTEDIYENIRTLGRILDLSKIANHLADSLSEIESKIGSATSNQIKYGTMLLISIDPLTVAGGEGYINELISKAGGKNVFGDIPDKYPQVTAEAILKRNPEFILYPTTYEEGYQELINLYPVLGNLQAHQQNRVFILNPDLIYRPGPRTVEGLAQMTRSLHSRINVADFFE